MCTGVSTPGLERTSGTRMDLVLRNVRLVDGDAVVIADGRMVLQGRRFISIDFDRLRNDVQATVERLREKNAPAHERMEAMAAFVSSHCVGLACEGYHVHRRLDAGSRTQ